MTYRTFAELEAARLQREAERERAQRQQETLDRIAAALEKRGPAIEPDAVRRRRVIRLKDRLGEINRVYRQLLATTEHDRYRSREDVADAMVPPVNERTIRRFMKEWEVEFGVQLRWPPPWENVGE